MASGLVERQASAALAERPRHSVRRFGPKLEWALLAGLLLLALGVRLPYLAVLPQFTDESLEVLWSLPIARGESFPLTNYDAYYGSLFNYLVAGAFVVLGPSALAARLVVLTTGVLTVLATYGLARAWNGPAAGLLAAALMAVSAAHIAINSHIAWANCTTPLFTTLAIWSLYVGVEGAPRSAPWLIASGFLWGLALQTHPSVATLLPAAALFVLWRRPRLLRTPWPYLAVAAFVLGLANLVVHNIEYGWESLTAAQRIRHHYALEDDAATSYPAALGAALLLLARVLGAALHARDELWAYLLDPLVLLGVGLALAGLVRETRRGNLLPLLLVASCLVLLPALNPKFRTLISSRYLMPLVPILLAGVAGLLIDALRKSAATVGAQFIAPSPAARPVDGTATEGAMNCAPTEERSPQGERWHRLLAFGATAATIALFVGPILALSQYYARAYASGENNARVYQVAALIREHQTVDDLLVLDESFGSDAGGVDELRALRYLLAFDDRPAKVLKITPRRLEEELETRSSLLIVLSGRQLREVNRLPLRALTPRPERGSEIGLFRLQAGY